MFLLFYNLSLFISVRAFLPSLRVLKTSNAEEEKIRIVSAIREKSVVSKLLVKTAKFVLNFEISN